MTQAWKFVMPDGTVIAIQGTPERAKAIMARVAEPGAFWSEVHAYGEGATIECHLGTGSACEAFVPGGDGVASAVTIYSRFVSECGAEILA